MIRLEVLGFKVLTSLQNKKNKVRGWEDPTPSGGRLIGFHTRNLLGVTPVLLSALIRNLESKQDSQDLFLLDIVSQKEKEIRRVSV